jgi:hypothetical protein
MIDFFHDIIRLDRTGLNSFEPIAAARILPTKNSLTGDKWTPYKFADIPI